MKALQRQIELLAPAGNFQGFIGALNGGADAVYLAGNKFGARAYADNFTEEEMKEVLFLAKLFRIKVYLTVNTLLKNLEMKELYDYIKPLYEMGLTGVIIQDFGVFKYLKEHFPNLELHASTQMTVTSLEGAKYLTEQGMKRIVLARELTMKEIKSITEAGMETECFIHGSMCYCYSGQCLFSSLIGGRSGNRGRCAQPCRLPYKVNKREEYCLSLKDMCTLEHLPELIDSGIASFKIEGRMKNPAYAAWVTHIYRKYIDAYLSEPEKAYTVDKKDLEQLKTLYIRTALQDGYYHKYRGESMITKESPAYSKTDEAFVNQITEQMIHNKPGKAISLQGEFVVGKPCCLKAEIAIDEEIYSVCVTGAEVQEALKAPLSKESLEERLSKTGDSYFYVENMEVKVEGNVFLPVKAINELRRQALEELQNIIIQSLKPVEEAKQRREIPDKSSKHIFSDDEIQDLSGYTTESNVSDSQIEKKEAYICFMEERHQLQPVLSAEYVKRIVLPYGWLLSEDVMQVQEACENAGKEVYFSLPAICRNESLSRVEEALKVAEKLAFGVGVYVNQTDSMAYILKNYPKLKCIGDINLYAMNNESVDWLLERLQGFTIPVELNKDEMRHMNMARGELIVYGRTPLMQTANCIFLTNKDCRKQQAGRVGLLSDRTNAKLPYRGHCDEKVCYNTLYNSVPTSLHKHKSTINSLGVRAYQLRFTTETEAETGNIIRLYKSYSNNSRTDEVPFSYTNGHFLRGVQ